MQLAGKLNKHYHEIDLVMNSNFDEATKQNMINAIQQKYRKTSKEANRKKKVSPAAERLRSKTQKKYNAEPNEEGRRGEHYGGGKKKGDKARTA
jgi:hypothetical protein